MMQTQTTTLSKRMKLLVAGVIGGLAGGVLFGFLMFMLGTLPMVAQLVGSQSLLVGVITHMIISSIFGAIFGILVEFWNANLAKSALFGIIYGLFWWVVGGLIIMPTLLGINLQLSAALAPANLWSLFGHLVYGLVTGVTVAFIGLTSDLWN